MLSASAFNLDPSKNLSFGKGLRVGVGVGIGVTNFKHRHISVITEDIYLTLDNLLPIKRATCTAKGDNSYCNFARTLPLF